MPTKPQIAQEAVRKLAEKLTQIAETATWPYSTAIEAELHRALDPLLEAIRDVDLCDSAHLSVHVELMKELAKWLK